MKNKNIDTPECEGGICKITNIKNGDSNMRNSIEIYSGDNLSTLKKLPKEKYELIYADPPYGTGKIYSDKKGKFSDFLTEEKFIDWIEPRLREIHRVMSTNGSFFIHMDYREIHYVKVLCDKIFGRKSFINEIIWQYDFGARQKSKWSTKHDTILWYAKDPKNYIFNLDKVDLIPKLAPGLPVSKNRKNPNMKTLTDVWWNTIVPTNGKERTGYPTQKPLAILERIVKVHSHPGMELLDPFAGSGSFGEAGLKFKRNVTLIDENPEAINVMEARLERFGVPTKMK